MKIPVLLLLGFSLLPLQANEKTFPLTTPASGLLEDSDAFAPFGRALAAELETLLAAQPDPARLKMLLAIRVHLGLYLGDDARALDSAARIKALLPDDANKAYAGLTTQALVAARQATNQRPGHEAFRAAFARDFAARLAKLPLTTAIRTMLEQQREKFTSMTAEALRGEFATAVAALERRSACTLAEADQLVRLRHRFADLLPLRAVLLETLDVAIATRPAS
jgi:hypothetical protein